MVRTPPSPMRVLLVEDNLDDVVLVERLLAQSRLPIRLAVARDVPQALEYLSASPPEREAEEIPELVLLDLGLPADRGFAVLRRMREDRHLCDVPVVVLSASQEERDVTEGLALGAHSHVLKPLTAKDLVWMAESVSNYRARLSKIWRLVPEGGGYAEGTQPQG